MRYVKLAPDPFLQNDDRIVVSRSEARFLVREAGTVLSPLGSLSYIINNLGNYGDLDPVRMSLK